MKNPALSLSATLEEARRLKAFGRGREALALLDTQRKGGESSPQLWQLMAEIFSDLGMPQAEEQVLREGLKIYPQDFLLSNALANSYYRADRCDEGLVLVTPLLGKKDCPPEIILTHGNLSKALGRSEAARKDYEAVLAHMPKNVAALSNLAGLSLDAQDYREAIRLFEQALDLEKDNAHIAQQLAQCYFREGNLEKAWHFYEARFGLKPDDPHATARRRPFSHPLWQGQKLKAHQTLLLWAEQGIGEEILHASMLADAARQGRIYVECDPRLVPLFARSFPDISFFARRDPPDEKLAAPGIAWQAPFGHLGLLFRNHFDDFPRSSYLRAYPQKIKVLRARYEEIKTRRGLSGKIIGMSWRSKKLRHGDPKSAPLGLWQPVFAQGENLFVSLQYGETKDDRAFTERQGWPLIEDAEIDQQKSLDDFAAQTAAMDAVITVSNTTAHMAGALGVKAAVLLPASRGLMGHWFDNRMDSPWYASLTLLRQEKDGDWPPVLARAQKFIQSLS